MAKKGKKANPGQVPEPERTVDSNLLSALQELKATDISFGGRIPHTEELRRWAVQLYGVDCIALATDREVEQRVLNAGWVPVTINTHSRVSEDTVYLIKREVLACAKVLHG